MTQRAWTAPQMAAIIDSAPDAMLIIDRDGKIVFANRQVQKIFGWVPDELTGQVIETLVPQPFRASHVAQRDTYCENPHIRPMGAGLELSAVRRDGSTFPVEISLSPLETEEGLFVVSSIRDATAYKRAARERMATIVDHAPLCITEMDRDGRILCMNPAGVAMFGRGSETEMIGRHCYEVVLEEDRDRVNEAFATVLAGDRANFQFRGAPDGRRSFAASIVPVDSEGGAPRIIGVAEDITARLESDRKLRENENLAHLGQMSAAVAHDIRNPLAGIAGAVEVFRGSFEDGSEERAMLEMILGRIRDLNRTIQDLLDFSRPTVAQPGIVRIKESLSRIADLFLRDPDASELTIDVTGDDSEVYCDIQLIEPVFLNLFQNAAYAMDHEGRVRVEVACAGEECAVAVRDDGPGISEDVRARVFEPFFTTKTRGTGLGLATARRVVEEQRGRIVIDCPEGGGTSVTVTLPTSRWHPDC